MRVYSHEEAHTLLGIGFCQSSFYKPAVWRQARSIMDSIMVPNDLAYPHDFGRGKGKYESKIPLDEARERGLGIMQEQGWIANCQGTGRRVPGVAGLVLDFLGDGKMHVIHRGIRIGFVIGGNRTWMAETSNRTMGPFRSAQEAAKAILSTTAINSGKVSYGE